MGIPWLSSTLLSCISFHFFPKLMFVMYFLFACYSSSLLANSTPTKVLFSTQEELLVFRRYTGVFAWPTVHLGVFIRALLLPALSNAGIPWGCFMGCPPVSSPIGFPLNVPGHAVPPTYTHKSPYLPAPQNSQPHLKPNHELTDGQNILSSSQREEMFYIEGCSESGRVARSLVKGRGKGFQRHRSRLFIVDIFFVKAE